MGGQDIKMYPELCRVTHFLVSRVLWSAILESEPGQEFILVTFFRIYLSRTEEGDICIKSLVDNDSLDVGITS
jgi:hypothetical protein